MEKKNYLFVNQVHQTDFKSIADEKEFVKIVLDDKCLRDRTQTQKKNVEEANGQLLIFVFDECDQFAKSKTDFFSSTILYEKMPIEKEFTREESVGQC